VLLAAAGTALLAGACAFRGPAAPPVSPLSERCYALSDSLSKYVSSDALPPARLAANVALPRTPSTLQSGDSVFVEFPVTPDGIADTTAMVITGTSDPDFMRGAAEFAARSRFTPAQMDGCSVISKYTLVLR
jgi:hypothetical protein